MPTPVSLVILTGFERLTGGCSRRGTQVSTARYFGDHVLEPHCADVLGLDFRGRSERPNRRSTRESLELENPCLSRLPRQLAKTVNGPDSRLFGSPSA